MEGECAAHWATLEPNAEDYNMSAAKFIAAGSGHLIMRILLCGDATIERLKQRKENMKKVLKPINPPKQMSPKTLETIKWVKSVTKVLERIACWILCVVLKISRFFTSSLANSFLGKLFFSLVLGEILLASLDGLSKICDALEVSGKNVMSTSSSVTTELVTHKYGEEAGKATSEGLEAAGQVIGTAWALFKIRKAFNPKSVINMRPKSSLVREVKKTN